MGVTGLLPFLQKASRPAKMREFSGFRICWIFDAFMLLLVVGEVEVESLPPLSLLSQLFLKKCYQAM